MVRFAEINQTDGTDLLIEPDAAARRTIAEALALDGLRKLRFEVAIRPEGTRDWRLEAKLGATVVQPCVVTLEPVTTRIDERVLRRYLSDLPAPEPGEVEMPEDDSAEPLPATLDLSDVMIEALSLALPAYPRAPGVPPLEVAVTEPGQTPLTDADVKPFAGLSALRDRLAGDAEE